MDKIAKLEKEIGLLKLRNARVEGDKAWETSWERKITIFVLTYAAISIYFLAARLPQPFLNAVVPSLAFVISTFSLPFFKEAWARSRKSGKQEKSA